VKKMRRRKSLVVKLNAATMRFFREQGAKGGRLGGRDGGKKRWEGVSAEDRKAHAKRAVAAREAKRRKR